MTGDLALQLLAENHFDLVITDLVMEDTDGIQVLKKTKELNADKMVELMAIDKKVKDGKLHLVLLKDIGEAVLTSEFDRDLLYSTLNELHKIAQ